MKLSFWLKDMLYRSLIAVSPRLLLQIQYRRLLGYSPDLDNPKTFNEKLTWYKLYYHDSLMTRCADKWEVRSYLKDKGLGEYMNDAIDVWDKADDIDFNTLPEKFVLKSTHGTAQTIVCKDKSSLDIEKARKKMKFWLKTNQCRAGYEWAYKDIKPRIIGEKLIETSDGLPPKDYKVFCFNGIPKFLFVASERLNNYDVKFDFYDNNWNLLPVTQGHPNSQKPMPKPAELSKMLEIASIASKDFPHVRVDFYLENGKLMIGELTFYHFDGFVRFNPSEYDQIFGSYFNLPEKRL
ncbi:MAG: glycosyl transferase [Muribaculum sp.]|nr:glycosyl transferase [Muribaculum sp.]